MAERNTDNPVPGSAQTTLPVESFDPDQVRPWRYHNRAESGMDEVSLDALADSIRRDGQQQLGLARRLPSGEDHLVEAIFGVRRLAACRRAGVPWRAEVRDASLTDADCAALMHSENEWTEGISPLENAVQWKSMLDAGVFRNQSALAGALGCHRGTVSRAIRTASLLFGETWIDRLVRPVMHEFSVRSADRLAQALADPDDCARAKVRARDVVPGTLAAAQLYEALFGAREVRRETVYVRRGNNTGRGPVTARIERDQSGGWSVNVRPHEQSPADMAELAEQVEALLAAQTASAAGVRLGRRIVARLTADEAKSASQSWLEGWLHAAAQACGLEWDRWRCASVAEALRTQRGGWERAVVRAIGGREGDPGGSAG